MALSEQDELQSALGTQYTLERELGRGGMATVYLARDAKHQRQVALKVLHTELSATLGPERFRREIATAARLQHPHMLSVFDSGETTDGRIWFTMPFVDGETLRERLRRERQLPLDEALRITRELAGALDYAHEHGVIHRDIKPENVLLTRQGNALLADFGVAQALATSAGTSIAGGTPSLTQTGASIGTPQYMSPEQASGQGMLDGRSDLYALGAVLYEMLAGEPPFTGPTAQAIIARMMSSEPPSIRIVRPSTPNGVDRVLRRALQPVPADRWASAGAFSRALDDAQVRSATEASTRARGIPSRFSYLAAVACVAAIGGFVAWRRMRDATSAPPMSRTSAIRIAVLPFENEGDTADLYFADGMTEAVHDKLAGVPGIEVIGTTSARQYRSTTKSPAQIGDELQVRYILEGRVRWAKGTSGQSRVRVSPELVDVRSSSDKWAQPFDVPMTDVFQMQADIASEVAEALQVALTSPAITEMSSRPTSDLRAYDAYLRGQSITQAGPSPSTIRLGIAAFHEAVTRDTTFALAWAALGRDYSELVYYGVPSPAFADSADQSTARALKLAPESIEAHAARSIYFTEVRSDYANALAEAEKGLARGPNAVALSAAANAEQHMGRWHGAAAHAAQAIELDPRDPLAISRAVGIQNWLRHPADARHILDRAQALGVVSVGLVELRALTYLLEGDLRNARATIRGPAVAIDTTTLNSYITHYFELGWTLDSAQASYVLRLRPVTFAGDTGSWALTLAQQYALRGDRARQLAYADSARADFVKQRRLAPNDAIRHALLGLSLAYLGRNADAIQEGRRAVALKPVAHDAFDGAFLEHSLMRIYIISGETDRALDLLEKLMSESYYLTPAFLRIDPNFAPLKGNARFERIAGAPRVQ